MHSQLFSHITSVMNMSHTMIKDEQKFLKDKYLGIIIQEEWLWDMRCWSKPKWQYSKAEVVEQIEQWLWDSKEDSWTYNCGHCLHAIKQLLELKLASIEEIADVVMRNNRIKYHNAIGSWIGGLLEEQEEDESEDYGEDESDEVENEEADDEEYEDEDTEDELSTNKEADGKEELV